MALISKTRDENDITDAAIPPLENGDRLARDEFERRWDLHPEIKKAELIDGQVYLQMTVSPRHGKPHFSLIGWLAGYQAKHPGCDGLADTTVRLGPAQDLQPDVLLRKVVGGTSTATDGEVVEGPPELAIEVAATSAAYDLHAKKDVYRRAGVQEYLVWQVFEERIDWWELQGGDFVALPAGARGVIESRVFPGLRLNVVAMLAGDMAAVLAELDASPSA